MKWELRSVVVAVASALGVANAQQAPIEKLEKVEVTGTRIPSSDVESASPISALRAEDIQLEGYSTLELILNTMPQVYADQGNRVSNGASGTSTVSLRGIGSGRTLVLLNGRRLPPGSPLDLAPDINQVPIALIQRVEILTGGASAIYGSDAIAGVVNFILKDRFDGVQGDVAYDFYNHSQKSFVADIVRARGFALPGDKSMDGGTVNASLTLGGNFAGDKGNAVLSWRYYHSDALLQSERDYSACALSATGPAACLGSDTTYPTRVFDTGVFPGDPTIDQRPARAWIVDPGTGSVRRYVRATDAYNFAPLNYYQRPEDRYGFNASANYDIAPSLKVYGEFGFHDDHTVAQVAASGLFSVEALVRWENPLLSDDWRSHLVFRNPDGTVGTGPGTVADVILSRRNVEGGGRQADLRHTSFREVLGGKGTVGPQWDYDVYLQSAEVVYQQQFTHDFSATRAGRALDVVTDPNGRPVCASALNGTDPSCVPYDPWSLNGVTGAALDYIETPAFQRGSLRQRIVGATVSGDLENYGIRLPRSRSVEFALGIERRSERLIWEVDSSFATGDLTGFPRPTPSIQGGYVVNDVFGELRVPVIDLLNLSGSYRRSDFDSGKKTDTFGLGFNATPARFLRVRGSVQRAVRAPNVIELFTPQTGGGVYDTDRCAGPEPTATLAQCSRTGVTAAQYGNIIESPEGTYPATVGGNPELAPEKARTYTLGITLANGANLSATIDYFNIRLDDTIDVIDPQTIVDQCLDTGNPRFCSLVHRDARFGTLWFQDANVIAINQNIGRLRTSGIDAAFNYTMRLGTRGVLALDALGTYVRTLSVEPYPGADAFDCAGLFGGFCGDPTPRWRHRIRAKWQTPWNLDVAATWRYIHSATLAPGAVDGEPAFPKLGARNYLDLAFTWSVDKHLSVRGSVNNVFDRDPPIAGGFGFNGNIYPQLYDALGRHFFVGATVRF
ncbi:MAG: TonB-dependent receptor plug domain-containing protein [Bacillota bacterium]